VLILVSPVGFDIEDAAARNMAASGDEASAPTEDDRSLATCDTGSAFRILLLKIHQTYHFVALRSTVKLWLLWGAVNHGGQGFCMFFEDAGDLAVGFILVLLAVLRLWI
jgi:hypothetical protein